MNYSPCRECAEIPKEFAEKDDYGIRLHVYFFQIQDYPAKFPRIRAVDLKRIIMGLVSGNQQRLLQ